MATNITLNDPAAQATSALAIPQRLGQVLVYLGINQSELARRLGMSPGFVSDVVRGTKRPGIEFMVALRQVLGVSVDWLLTGDGSMLGGTGIRQELFQTIRLQIAVARAAVMESDPIARSLILLIREGQLATAVQNPLFKNLLNLLAPSDADIGLAIELYNGHQWAADPVSQRRNLLAAATAYFEARKPIDRMQEFTGTGAGVATQVNSGAGQRISALDVQEHHTKGGL